MWRISSNTPIFGLSVALACTLGTATATAQQGDGAAELAALLQDPLANLAALMTDNTVSLRSGPDNDEAYEIQLQPVYSLNFPNQGFTVVPRAVIPFVGVKPGTDLPRLDFDEDDELVLQGGDDKGREWGLSDIVTQFFYTPMGQERAVKWGAGPMISFKTRTDTDVKGAGGGAGPIGVLVGDAGPVSYAAIGGHLWGFDGDFSTSTLQPMVYYNFESVPGAYIAYNNTIAFDHKTKGGGGNSWTVPLGLLGGRTFDMGGGHGLDLSIGAYHLPSWGRPAGGAEYQVKFGLTWIFPR